MTVDDINWSCPADLEPYEKAYTMEQRQNDAIAWMYCGNYVLSAVSVAVEHCLAGKKAKSQYIKEPVLQKEFVSDSLTQEEIDAREIQKMILAEEQWIKVHKRNGLPETKILGIPNHERKFQ